MTAWSPLPRSEEDHIWERFKSRFRFRPSTNPDCWPAIREPRPSVTYSLAGERPDWREGQEPLGSELNMALLRAFQGCTAEDEALYVLDWQHDCFWLHPHREFAAKDWSQWEIPIYPDGDYYIFLEQNLSFGTFGHPWEHSLCVFGRPLLQLFEPTSVSWLGPVIRRDGRAV